MCSVGHDSTLAEPIDVPTEPYLHVDDVPADDSDCCCQQESIDGSRGVDASKVQRSIQRLALRGYRDCRVAHRRRRLRDNAEIKANTARLRSTIGLCVHPKAVDSCSESMEEPSIGFLRI